MTPVKVRKYPAVPKPAQFRQDEPVLRLKELAGKLESITGDGREIGGTGLTKLKLQGSPVARLLDLGKIHLAELRAVQDIEVAHHALWGALSIRAQSFEKIDRSHSNKERASTISAVKRYKFWARHWSIRKERGDPTLALTWAAVIDHQSFHSLDVDYRLAHGRAQKTVAIALRDYVARAGWADPREARAWIEAAEANFSLRVVDKRP